MCWGLTLGGSNVLETIVYWDSLECYMNESEISYNVK